MHVDGAGNLVLDDVSYTSQYGLPGARDVHASPQQDGWMISLSALSIPSLSGKRYLRTYRWGDSSTLHPLINFALGSNFDDRQMPAAVSAEGRTLFAWEQGLVAGDIKTSFWKGELEILPNVNAPPNGILSLQQPLARSANRQIDVDLAANIGSDKHLLVYSDARGYKAAIRGAHLNSSGVVIGEVFDISDYKFGAGDPRVARLDGGWLAAWRSNPKRIRVLPIDVDGSAASSPTEFGDNKARFVRLALAPRGDGAWLVAHRYKPCSKCVGGLGDSWIVAWPLDAQGAMLDGSDVVDVIRDTARPASDPAMIWDDTRGDNLVVWVERPVTDLGRARLRAARLSVSGKLEAVSVVEDTKVVSLSSQTEPAVAVGGGRTFVVWRDDRNGGEQIFGAMLAGEKAAGAGELCEPGGFAISQTAGIRPAVSYADDGHAFLVTWQGSPDGAPSNLYGAWVTTDCEVLDKPNAALATGEGDELAPVLARVAAGRMLLAYARDVPLPPGSERIEIRVVDSGVLDGQACAEDSECASRRCTDGVCCRQICATCQRCAADTGKCETVVGEQDDSCNGAFRCDASGACEVNEGESCGGGAECASGFCVDGVCCDRACDSGCERCDRSPGVCTRLDCHPFTCNAQKICLERCSRSQDCAPNLQCFEDGRCAPPMTSPVNRGCSCSAVGLPAQQRAAPWWLGLGLGLGLAATRAGRRLRQRSREKN
jgi:hypothetical protein